MTTLTLTDTTPADLAHEPGLTTTTCRVTDDGYRWPAHPESVIAICPDCRCGAHNIWDDPEWCPDCLDSIERARLSPCSTCGSTATVELHDERDGREQSITICAGCGAD